VLALQVSSLKCAAEYLELLLEGAPDTLEESQLGETDQLPQASFSAPTVDHRDHACTPLRQLRIVA
jgi:hypothetical protein